MACECSFRRLSVVPDVSDSVPPLNDPVAGVDPSISEDEDDPDYVLFSASESGPCSGDEEVLRSVPTSVLAARARKCSVPPAVPSDESSVDLRDNELSPASDPVDPVPGTPDSASAVVASDPDPVSISDPVPGTPESAFAVVPDPVSVPVVPVSVPDPVPGTPVSASAACAKSESSVSAPAKEYSGSKPKKKKPRSAAASSSATSTSVKSVPAKSTPAKSTSVPGPPFSTYWEASCHTGFGYVLQDCTGDPVYFDFGHFSRSIEIDSTTFEYDRFVKYVHHDVERPYLCLVALLVPRNCLLALRWNFPSLLSDLFPPHRVPTASCLTVVKLPCFLVFNFWWARFDTSASLAEWFPLHTVLLLFV